MKTAGLILTLFALAACGGGDRNSRSYAVPGGAPIVGVYKTSGPIYSACMRSGRKAANARMCGCVQAVASGSLSGSDQRQAADFYSDPHRAQVVRQSDNPANERFWKRYVSYADRAEQSCRGL